MLEFGNTGITPGHCLVHGYHGGGICPTCSTSVIFRGQHYSTPQPQPSLGEWQKCPICDGSGAVWDLPLFPTRTKVCPTCHGARMIARPRL